ncbi:Mitochondrial 2-oxoglutarate/malate carrier protein [Dufourea novaeangliae]|uniref:Mitochondrial 2-oxoglutarate/malate carrier protein n=1 Tax=Dufourea novaeangliae TaxID=178035 RepID=A0A154PDZ2_DUFNO|nr:Mitochondrial 2-oxoglutarate/malate carrier protein [Dufourea novaeangliae]
MDRHDELLRTEEIYSQCIESIKNSILGIQREFSSAKQLLGHQRNEIMKRMSVAKNVLEIDVLKNTQDFHEHIIKEIMDIEKVCEEHLLRLKIELLTTTKERMQPPSRVSLRDVKKICGTFLACDTCGETTNEMPCRCFWENIPKWSLENTQNILANRKMIARSELDESDLKFKQDMIYLRTKMFSLPRKPDDQKRRMSVRQSKTDTFTDLLKETKKFDHFSVVTELSKISNLKFIDGKFVDCHVWGKILDRHGNQYGTKWYLVLCPQIEKMLKKRHVPMLHLNPSSTFAFLSKILENGANFVLLRPDLISLLDDKDRPWLERWKLQFQLNNRKHIAVTLIQARYRGYMLRKMKTDSELLYIAASVLWLCWLTLKKKREIHERYLMKMLISLQTTRELSLKLNREFNSIIQKPHVVIHLPSFGYPVDLRRAYIPQKLAIEQNMASLRMCFVRNPNTEVIYILSVRPTKDLLLMYSDFIESIRAGENIAKRITFIALSQGETFSRCTLNLSRILHCSEDSLNEIRQRIAGKRAYFLPLIVDECDMRLAGNLGVALLSPDMEVQRKFLNKSIMSAMIDGLGLAQPPHYKHIHNYETLCSALAQMIIHHTEICAWVIKLNFGTNQVHRGIFLINHISIPFMPSLRKEREKFGDTWGVNCSVRNMFLDKLTEHLPKIVSAATRLSRFYDSWKDFYSQLQKMGSLLQAVPVKKDDKAIAVSLFIPRKGIKDKVKWLGTADIVRLDVCTVSTRVYMIPQTSLVNTKLEPIVNKFAKGMQNEGYFGYVTVDCYCYPEKNEEKLGIMLLHVYPFYTDVHSYMEWMKFSTGGTYISAKNRFIADIPLVSRPKGRLSGHMVPDRTPKWNETTSRYGIAISNLYHSRFSAYSWPQLKELFETSGIVYNSERKQGSSILLYDSELRTEGLMVIVGPSMTTTISMLHNSLATLNQTLMKSKTKSETNITDLLDILMNLLLDYHNLSTDLAAGQTATHPLDVTKVRMQLSKASLTETVRTTLHGVGVRGFFVGWTAGLLRQLTYSTARLGMYTTLYDLCQQYLGCLNYPTMIGMGMISGVVGSFVGSPTDLVLIRMIADVNLPPEKRWNYRNGFVGLITIAKNEGVRALWRGSTATVIRGAVVNGTQLGTYSKVKLMLIDTGRFHEGVLLQFCSAMISGLVTCSVSLPLDVSKTRLQNWTSSKKSPNLFGMILYIVQKEGVRALWRGFLPYYCRAAPNSIITMICVDQLHRIYIKLFLVPQE